LHADFHERLMLSHPDVDLLESRRMPDRDAAAVDVSALEKLFRPKSIAVVGASPKRGTARNTLVRVLQKHGYEGVIYPVTPSHEEVEGLRAYPSIDALPEAPDLALIITPAETVPEIVAACGKKGTRSAIVYSAGFEEVATGKQHARKLAEAARLNDVTVLGANCQGLWSVRERAVLSFGGAAFTVENLQHSSVAVVSQSGALSTAIGNYLQRSGIGCSYIVSVGNETCIDLLDILVWLIEQDDVRVIALYLEGLSRATRIVEIAERARQKGIQIVALKTGRSVFGQRATASHTGKIASSHAVYTSILEQAGIISVDSLAEALAAVEVLAFLPNPRKSGDPKGGVAVLSSSGGAGALLADQSEQFSIPMAEFSPPTVEVFDRLLPPFAHKANPVDLTGQIFSIQNLFSDSCATLAADPRTEALVVQFASSGMRNLQENKEVFLRAGRQGGFPVVISMVAEMTDRETRAQFRDAGVLLVDDTAMAMRALSWLYQRQRFADKPKHLLRPALAARPAPRGWEETMSFCADALIAPARWKVLGPHDGAAVACADMKYPLVVKVLPSEAEHKTEMGLVKLRVRGAEEVDGHIVDFRKRLAKPELPVLVQEMIDGGVEVVISCLYNTDFGPIISIGSGGVAIELYRDVFYLALPVTEAQVLEALRRLKLWTLLTGFRGQPRADIEALARAAVRLGDLFLAATGLLEFEINPLIVRPAGEGVVAVDALVATEAADIDASHSKPVV
jgi:acetate---CoA ligase (ADP-forming)